MTTSPLTNEFLVPTDNSGVIAAVLVILFLLIVIAVVAIAVALIVVKKRQTRKTLFVAGGVDENVQNAMGKS